MNKKQIKEMAQDELLSQLSVVKFLEVQERCRKLDSTNGVDVTGNRAKLTELTEEEANAVAEQMGIQAKRIATQLFGYTNEYRLLD